MRLKTVIPALLACILAFAPDGLAAPRKGRRIEAGPSFLWMEGGFSENIVYIDNDFPEHWLQKSDKP